MSPTTSFARSLVIILTRSCPCRDGTVKCHEPSAPEMWLPFSCPLDHVLNLTALDDSSPDAGWAVAVRESGFLSSPRVPSAMRVRC